MRNLAIGIAAILATGAFGCSKTEDPETNGSGRNFKFAEDGNGELNVIGCKLIPTVSLEDMPYMPYIESRMFADLSVLKAPGDKIDNVVVFHQRHATGQPEQLGLVRLTGWSVTFAQDEAGEDILQISGRGELKDGKQRHISYTVPFWEGLYPTQFTARDSTADGAVLSEDAMNCEVSFWRR